jgi:hypothetical protein
MRIGAAAIIGLGMVLACDAAPAGAQTETQTQTQTLAQSPIASVAKNAFLTAKARCATFVAAYRGGVLDGKIVLLDEPLTDAMKANDAIPSESEAVILRGYMAADARCAALEIAFARDYMPWDVPTEEYARAAQVPIYEALAARQISWGKANRELDNVAVHTKELRGLALPKGDNGGALTVAQEDARRKCQAIYAAVPDPTMGGKLLTGQALTSAALAIRERPSAAEAATVKAVRAAHDACGQLNIEVTKTYIPWYLPVIREEQAMDDDVYAALANSRISYGEANRRFADIAKRVSEDARQRVEELSGKSTSAVQARAQSPAAGAETAARQMASAASPPANAAAARPVSPAQAAVQAAYRDTATRCANAIAPFKTGPLAGKIRMRHETITPLLLANADTPSEQEAALLSDYVGAYMLCQAYETRFVAAYLPWLMPVHDMEVQRERPVFGALIEANHALKDIEQDVMREGDRLTQAQKTGGGEMQAFSRMLQPGNN